MSSSRAIAGARQRRAGEPVSAANYVQQQQSQPQQQQRQPQQPQRQPQQPQRQPQQQSQPQPQQQSQPQQYSRQQNNMTVKDESNNFNGVPSGKVPLPYAVMILSTRLNEMETKMHAMAMPNYSSVMDTNANANNVLNSEVVEVVNSIAEKVDFLEQVIYKIDNERITELEKKFEDSKNVIIQLQMMIMETNKQVLGFINMAHQQPSDSVPVPVPELVMVNENKQPLEVEPEPEQNNISTDDIQPQVTMEINELNVNA